MTNDNEITAVIFRFDEAHDEVFALFPYLSYRHNYRTTGYAHLGQHFECDYNQAVAGTRPATYEEYKPLLWELQGVGYQLKIIKRAQHNKMYQL